jgi:hypothetical protein
MPPGHSSYARWSFLAIRWHLACNQFQARRDREATLASLLSILRYAFGAFSGLKRRNSQYKAANTRMEWRHCGLLLFEFNRMICLSRMKGASGEP